jgi:hypothetical protein
MKEAANRGGLTSGRGRLNVRREWYQIERSAQFVNFRFNISRFIHQSDGHSRVLGGLGDPKQNRSLRRKVRFCDHSISPVVSQRPADIFQKTGCVETEITKLN